MKTDIQDELKKIKDILVRNNLKISCAESLTTGHVQTMLGQLSKSSKCFVGGITAYNIDQKVKHLNGNRAIAKTCDCVCQSTAAEMAVGVVSLFNTEVSIATTGFAELPDGKVPYAYYAVYIKDRLLPPKPVVEKVEGEGKSRVEVQKYIAEEAIKRLVRELSYLNRSK